MAFPGTIAQMVDSSKPSADQDEAAGLVGPPDAVPLELVQRILVVKFRHLGDVLLLSAFLSVLKRAMPNAAIDVCVYSDTISMLRNHPAVRKLFTVDKGWKKLGLGARLGREWGLLRKLRGERYDLVFNLTEGDRGAIAALVSGATWRVGLDDPRDRRNPLRYFAFTHRFRTDHRRRHMVEQNLDALRRIGISVRMNSEPLSFIVDERDRDSARDKLIAAGWQGGEYALVHPTSRWMFKCLPTDRVAELMDYLAAREMEIVLTAAPDEKERSMAADILCRTAAPVRDLSGAVTLGEMAALLADARLFAGADSAPMHMAAALQVPSLAWFGPSFDVVWKPWQVRQRLVSLDVSCRPCGFDGCGGGKRSECLVGIDTAALVDAADELLQGLHNNETGFRISDGR